MDLVITLNSDKVKLRNVAKALSDNNRMEILLSILNQNAQNLNYGGIAQKISKSCSDVTNHMNWLKRADLIEDLNIEGKRGKMQKIPRLKYDKIVIVLNAR